MKNLKIAFWTLVGICGLTVLSVPTVVVMTHRFGPNKGFLFTILAVACAVFGFAYGPGRIVNES